MTKLILIILALTFQAETTYDGQVIEVIDGSSLVLQLENRRLRVQLSGIESPVQTLRNESRKNLSRLVKGKTVKLLAVDAPTKTSKDESIVGKIFFEDKDVGLEQIREGMAWQSDEPERYQSSQEKQSYLEAESAAKASKRGVWSDSFKKCKGDSKVSEQGQFDQTVKHRVTGVVRVEVEIDISGDVSSAITRCGHPVLQTYAVKSVLKMKFKPTILSGQPIMVTGYITYIFTQ